MLPDGRQQLKVHCNTIVDYVTMPKDLRVGPTEVFKMGWNEENKLALYCERDIPEDVVVTVNL